MPEFRIDDLGVKTIKRKEKRKNYQVVVLDCINKLIESSSDLFPSLLLLREVWGSWLYLSLVQLLAPSLSSLCEIWSKMLYDVAGGNKAKVSDVLLNGTWKMLPAKSEALAQIQSGLSSIPLCEAEWPFWITSRSGICYCKETLKWLEGNCHKSLGG